MFWPSCGNKGARKQAGSAVYTLSPEDRMGSGASASAYLPIGHFREWLRAVRIARLDTTFSTPGEDFHA